MAGVAARPLPPTLVLCGKYDVFFITPGALALMSTSWTPAGSH
jgi:hypothetical protein